MIYYLTFYANHSLLYTIVIDKVSKQCIIYIFIKGVFFMRYERPENIDIFFLGGFDLPVDVRNNIINNFRDVAFCMFTLLDSENHKIGHYEIKVESQENMFLDNILLYYMGRCIFELRECNSGKWCAIPSADSESIQQFCNLIDYKYDVWKTSIIEDSGDCIDNCCTQPPLMGSNRDYIDTSNKSMTQQEKDWLRGAEMFRDAMNFLKDN